MSRRIASSIKRGLRGSIAHARGEAAGMRTRIERVPDRVDVKAIRGRTGMTQRVFARRFGFPLETLRNWERGHRSPKGAARALLTVIAKRPDAVIEALGE